VATRLVRRYLPGRRVLIVLPDLPDLALETQMRAGRAGPLYLGDPAQDMWIPSVWEPRISRQIASLAPHSRALIDRAALGMAARLRGHPADYALSHPVPGGNPESEWIMHRLDETFTLIPVHRGPGDFVVVSLVPRAA
jgi:hypothetical protein